jgi:hypothetical protein
MIDREAEGSDSLEVNLSSYLSTMADERFTTKLNGGSLIERVGIYATTFNSRRNGIRIRIIHS